MCNTHLTQPRLAEEVHAHDPSLVTCATHTSHNPALQRRCIHMIPHWSHMQHTPHTTPPCRGGACTWSLIGHMCNTHLTQPRLAEEVHAHGPSLVTCATHTSHTIPPSHIIIQHFSVPRSSLNYRNCWLTFLHTFVPTILTTPTSCTMSPFPIPYSKLFIRG